MLVVDGARPAEIGNGLMPNLPALRDGGMSFPRARSLPVMETLPNHVMMMTGVRPDRSHVPANTVLDRDEQVLSKEYPFGIFGRRATYRREPAPVVPVSGHAPDAFTMDTAIGMVETLDPNLVFVNLGDCDWMGHPDQLISLQPAFDAEPVLGGHVVVAQDADLSYWTGPAARRTAAVDRMRRVTAGAPGVLSVRTPQQLRLGGNAGGYDWRGLL